MRRHKLVVVVAAVIVAACSGSDPVAPPPGTVSITNNAFNPTSITVAAGGQVTWTWNSGGAAHNVTFAAVAGAPTNIANTTAGSVARTFATAGTFNYQCTLHGAGMSGSVTVN